MHLVLQYQNMCIILNYQIIPFSLLFLRGNSCSGKIFCTSKIRSQQHILDLIVVKALLGRDWLSRIRVDWKNVFKVKAEVTK